MKLLYKSNLFAFIDYIIYSIANITGLHNVCPDARVGSIYKTFLSTNNVH